MAFEKGKSGNPAGRPKGKAPTTAKELREAINARSVELVNRLIDVALVDGDVVALKYLIDKVLPSLPPEQIEQVQTPPKEITFMVIGND
jgi:Family of unknown function (DUF5681)